MKTLEQIVEYVALLVIGILAITYAATCMIVSLLFALIPWSLMLYGAGSMLISFVMLEPSVFLVGFGYFFLGMVLSSVFD